MPRAQFSERQFEFAINFELTTAWRAHLLGAAPVIPSTSKEADLGYDAVYQFRSGRELFLQYKRSNYASRRTWTNARIWDLWNQAYLRAELLESGSGICEQHNMLVALANTGQEVYYCGPCFYERSELDAFVAASNVWANSMFAPLAGAPTFSGVGSHCITYPPHGDVWRLHSPGPEDEQNAVPPESVIEGAEIHRWSRRHFSRLAASLRAVLSDHRIVAALPDQDPTREPLAEVHQLLALHFDVALALLPSLAPVSGAE